MWWWLLLAPVAVFTLFIYWPDIAERLMPRP